MMITENRLKYSSCYMFLLCDPRIGFFVFICIGAAGSIGFVNWNH